MKILITILLVLACLYSEASHIIPAPNHYKATGGKLKVPKKVTISASDQELRDLIPLTIRFGEKYFDQTIVAKNKKGFVELIRNEALKGDGQYQLEIRRNRIRIEAGTAKGSFYALQSLLQLLNGAGKNGQLDCAIIQDQPRYEWRGLMLDESRHFYGMEAVKQTLDMMAIHKMNIFHWHLTDVPGWRVEIKQYPLLTTIGGIGNELNRNAPAQFYTQAQVKEIVQYASERFIEVVPEIDMPGHATAAVKAYPEYSGGGTRQNPDFTFNPGLASTYAFLTNILREVAALFPSDYIHIGGDEVHFGNQQWPDLPAVQQLQKTHRLENMVQVEHYFLQRMADSVRTLGRKIIGWDEVLPAALPKESTLIMWWRHNRPQVLKEALEKEYEVVLCPRIPMYFDFVQHSQHKYGRMWDTIYVPLKSVYEFPSPAFTGGTDVNHPLIKGIQANLWTPTMHNMERLQFMLYPRISALAEAAWTNDDRKNFDNFTHRLHPMLLIYDRQGIRYFDYRDEAAPEEPGPGEVKEIKD